MFQGTTGEEEYEYDYGTEVETEATEVETEAIIANENDYEYPKDDPDESSHAFGLGRDQQHNNNNDESAVPPFLKPFKPFILPHIMLIFLNSCIRMPTSLAGLPEPIAILRSLLSSWKIFMSVASSSASVMLQKREKKSQRTLGNLGERVFPGLTCP